ncbi:hypothetical protein PUNSTDRAFT_88876 [Punctularia strigosozonata HHB-11173 SS5]|uniref:uncharacterized protein n=1 Tax=Punctularia strigosozonata (strain HHB-11173) TaxID=741275 RepID=UPI00044172DC|nr:uncharacterized protein PUNSTDRAFT_88876 [Punctularia strigosozonata HHB-11173 SS5]EIN08071.1 hypothetical protein PUNSTDRAFT_88876 [Punctularia strigosozonata HHB-11173 SS5]
MSSYDLEKQTTTADEVSVMPVVIEAGSSLPSGSNSTSSIKEKEKLEDSEDDIPKLESYPIPPKKGNKVTRYLLHNFFSTYRKIFTVVFFANITALIVFTVRNKGLPKAPEVGSAASANLMVTILFRQENFVNIVYEILCACPHSAPLWLRKRLAKAFHYGGAHSGAGVAAVFWYILYTVIATRDFTRMKNTASTVNVATSYVLLAFFCFILGGAHPYFRRTYHDYFEAMHRYSGWCAVLTFWTHTIFAGLEYRKLEPNPPSLGMYLITSSNFWTFVISSSATLLSWGRLRLRDVYPEILSNHVIRLHFKYKKMPPFYGLKVSTRPLVEWHAFATVPDEEGFSIVVSNAGDWTKEAIMNPPKKLWVRGYPLHGLLYTSKLFKQIVVVATGSGIGPILSLLYADITPRRVLWSTPNPETTFGDKIVAAVNKADPNAVIWNTRSQGRPDMVQLTWQLVQECNAEAVFIISNPKITKKVVYAMQTRGVAAYGAIFDS